MKLVEMWDAAFNGECYRLDSRVTGGGVPTASEAPLISVGSTGVTSTPQQPRVSLPCPPASAMLPLSRLRDDAEDVSPSSLGSGELSSSASSEPFSASLNLLSKSSGDGCRSGGTCCVGDLADSAAEIPASEQPSDQPRTNGWPPGGLRKLKLIACLRHWTTSLTGNYMSGFLVTSHRI